MKYKTLKQGGFAKHSVKGSRFFAEAHPLNSTDEAESILMTVRKKYHDATHHCYGWRFGHGNEELFRYSDDGEPSGTAGKPIFDMSSKFGLSNLIIIVTRYFGGTKLGTGGLVKAYSQAAEMALEGAESIVIEKGQSIVFSCTYEQHPVIMREISHFSVIQLHQDFLEKVTIQVEIDENFANALIESVYSATAGKVTGIHIS
jgi:uncharacterized YigZ family protein